MICGTHRVWLSTWSWGVAFGLPQVWLSEWTSPQSEQSQSRPPLRVDLPTLTMVAVSESASSASSSTSSNDWTLVDIGSRASTSVPTISPSVASSSQTGYFYAAEQHGALTLPTQPPTELWHPSSAQPPPNRELPTPNPPLTQTTHAFHSSGFWV